MKKILIADDSAFMRTVIKDILGRTYEIIEAESGTGCLEEFSRSSPDLVLLDVVMPEGEQEGLRVLRRIIAEKPSSKVIMITALGGEDAVVKECLSAGALGCVCKPFDDERVLKLVQEALG